MMPYLLLLLDCVAWNYWGQWFIFSTMAYFTVVTVKTPEYNRSFAFYNALFAFLLEDFLVNGRFGLGLIYVIILLCMVALLKEVLLNAPLMLGALGVIVFFLLEDLLIKYGLFSTYFPLSVTSMKILINVGISVLVLWGRRGNRSRY
jgi:hypothetical protein